jgi:hypothetical protein
MKIYIAGPMTGLVNYNFFNFFRIEKKLLKEGYETINPAYESLSICNKLNKKLEEVDYNIFMEHDLSVLKKCEAIYMLKNWEHSKGANLEYGYAIKHNYIVFFESDSNKE